MRHQAFLCFPAVIAVFLIIWGMSTDLLREKTRKILAYRAYIEFKDATSAPQPKCSLSRVCPPNHFALHIRSGAANVVGPQICFEDKMIMSNVLNNVGSGLNIAVVNGENGTVEKIGYQNVQANSKDPEDMLAFLKDIKPGMIVLVASFDDVTKKMTDEMREAFVGMGSTLIKSIKPRDNWVFVGRAGAENRSLFEKQTINDKTTNLYDGWPGAVELAGCFPKTPSDEHEKP